MYLSYYNLESKPFQMSTDPGFLWMGEKHKEALATLRYAIIENKGILALTGDVGTGKTTLINALIQSLGDDTKEYKNRALRQRITLNYHIQPLTLSETEAYIRHRLEIAGVKAHIFSSGAIQEIFSFSSGYPRLINIICDHALLSGYVRKILIITQDIIKECKEELQISNLKTDQDTDNSVDEIESEFKVSVIQQEESPEHRKTPNLLKEKRLYKRFPAKLPIELKAITSTRKRVLLVETKDMSATGAFIYTKESSYIPDDTRFILNSFYPKKSTIKLKNLKQLKNCTCTMVRSTSEGIAICFDRPVELFV